MSEVDLDRVRTLARQMHTALGLDAEQRPTKTVRVETRYEDAEDGSGTHVIDLDADGNEVARQWVPNRKVGHGLEPAEGEL